MTRGKVIFKCGWFDTVCYKLCWIIEYKGYCLCMAPRKRYRFNTSFVKSFEYIRVFTRKNIVVIVTTIVSGNFKYAVLCIILFMIKYVIGGVCLTSTCQRQTCLQLLSWLNVSCLFRARFFLLLFLRKSSFPCFSLGKDWLAHNVLVCVIGLDTPVGRL